MERANRIALILFLTLLPSGMRAQESQTPPDEEAAAPPLTLNGQGPSVAFQSELNRGSYVAGGVNFTGMYTDNAFLSTSNQVDNFSYYIQPRLSLSQSTPRLTWDLGVGAGLIVNQNLSEQNQAAENLGLNLTYKLAPHVSLRLSNTFINTTGLFSGLGPGVSGPGIGVIEQPNNSLIIPLAQRSLTDSSLAELTYQFSPNSFAGVRGGYSLTDFPDSSQNTQFGPLYNTRTYLGEAFYNYRMSARQWVGVTFQAQKIATQPSLADTNTGSLLFLYAVNATPTVTLSFFGGPQYSDFPAVGGNSPTALPRGHLWTSSEGATLNWKGAHTSIVTGFSRQISDGGGLSTAVTYESANAVLRRELGNRDEVEFGFTFSQNDPLQSNASFHGFSGQAQFQHRITNSLVARMGYGRQQQDLPTTQGEVSTNRTWFSVSYDFTRPLGK